MLQYRPLIYTGALLLVVVIVAFTAPPRAAQPESMITVPTGLSATGVAQHLKAADIIYSPLLFRVAVLLEESDQAIKSGSYLFEKPVGVWHVATRMINGDFGQTQISVRLPEGSTRMQMAAQLEDSLPGFDTATFLTLTEGEEGYLFPDTYFFAQDATAETVVETLETTFNKKIEGLKETFASSDHSLEDIITMASLIEKEVHNPDDQRIVSGILWKRLDIGMALQVDAPFFYVLGKTSSELTREDLETDSLYNTYTRPGLPPTPIGNPGLSAIEAALDPLETEYLFYLSDTDGVTHYARDFEEHKENKIRYLR